ncbi:5'-3' exonuclease [Egibacter rhizosphaerae]|uniref:5'-3' exonuclease n=1 Tax=Egibacter rhizosphaerae TaxID=1670831 RepID=A0A411YK81_9ACTN|nr:5'-3' exonuclease [Egibacter rhizosphaerae]QBI21618.1 5'-3' exonuclease [Egibacter rhizosphaerae]
MTHRLLLDTSSLVYRAFFALPTSITDGRMAVNAVRGYLDMVARLVDARAPDEVLHCRDDDWRPAERAAAWPGYKAQRADDPEELPAQFPLLTDVLARFGQVQVAAPDWEADDAIGVLAASAEAGDVLEIVTGDRDLLQLVRDGDPAVRVLYTVKGVSELAEFDESAVGERYGVPPQRYVDYAILRGDPSDGLPGVSGVGEKTARDLVARYPDLAALQADARALSPKLAQRIAGAGEYFEAMQRVVPVRTDVPLRIDRGERDDRALDRLAEDHNLEGPVGRLRAALDGTQEPA